MAETPQPDDASAPLRRFAFCSDEVNQVVVSAKGDALCAASDSGEIAVVELASGTLARSLRRGHSNIVAGLAFRPSRPSELVSVGLDARCVCWELGNAGRVRCVSRGGPACFLSLSRAAASAAATGP